jgi:enoyl-CoA hydratase
MAASIRLERDGGVAHLVLDAPERRNALTSEMLVEIADAVRAVKEDITARALVVSGAGKSFCAGADLTSLFGDLSRPPFEIRDQLKGVYAGFLGLLDLTIPTIAAVNGAAVGAGTNIALACDVTLAGPHARFAITFADIGLHPGGGCSWFLTRRLGPQRALMVLLGAETLDAEAAARAGLVAEATTGDPVERALELARLYARRDPALVRDAKRAVQMSQQADLLTVLEFESWAQASSATKPDFAAFVAGFGRTGDS